MQLQKLEISGFKSFAEKVELSFEKCVSAIVGPNGCGKSNISDAIRWVLGEQSAKALRCNRMEDLIFNGGASQKPSEMAEISLLLSNENGKLAIDSPQIEITRQLERSGESKYYLNKVPCLLRDINELFMDTGIGVNAYSLMEQSKIDLILNSRPQDRRFIFEEVAGINKYRHRKKIALKKLEETEANITTLNNVIAELENQTESLKKQAEQAEEYQKYYERLKMLEVSLSRTQFSSIVSRMSDLSLQLSQIQSESDGAVLSMNELEDSLQNATTQREEFEAKIEESQAQVRQIEGDIERTESDIRVYKERQLGLQAQRQKVLAEIEALEERSKKLDEQRAERQAELESLQISILKEEAQLKGRQNAILELDSRANSNKKAVDEAKAEVIETASQSAKIQNELSSLQSKLEYSDARLSRLAESSKQVKDELEAANQDSLAARRQVEALEAELTATQIQQKKLEAELSRLNEQRKKFETELRGMQDSLGLAASRLRSLEELQSSHEGYYTGVRAILKVKELQPKQFAGVCGVIAELLRTSPEYELAIEVALGNGIQNIVTETAEDAKRGIELLKSTKAGRVTFLPLDILRGKRALPSNSDFLKQPGVIGIAADMVNFDPKYTSAIDYLLGGTLIVENLDLAIKIAKAAKANLSMRLVTLEGELLNTAGAITGGSGKVATSGLLQRPREIDELQKKVAKIQNELSKKRKDFEELGAKLSTLEAQRNQLASAQQERQLNLVSARKELAAHEERKNRLDKELSQHESEENLVKDEVETLHSNESELKEQLENLQRAKRDSERKITHLEEELSSLVAKKDEIDKSCTEMRVELASKNQRVKAIEEALENFSASKNQFATDIENLKRSLEEGEKVKDELSEDILEHNRKFTQLQYDREVVVQQIESYQQEKERLLEAAKESEKKLRSLRNRVEKLSKTRHDLDVAETQYKMQLETVVSRTLEMYKVDISDVAQLSQLSQFEALQSEGEKLDVSSTTVEIEDLKSNIEALGSVNLLAIAEYAQVKQRHELLTSQISDLKAAKEDLYEVLKKINDTSTEIFMETFKQINLNFQEVFSQLFSGGEADLKLVDEADILESGIEIIARPPGKRPQSISMLSGGERTLVAIALLFAIFKIKPSPFCVLDEVDAALDEANVKRFTDMIRAFSKDTQFILITHNKRTMEIADVMYGVTMEKAGISKLVSVKLT